MTLTDAEREALSDWWLTGSEGDLHATVEAIIAARLAPVLAETERWQQKWKRRGLTIERLKAERDLYRRESAEHLALLDGRTAAALARAALGVSAPTGDGP